MKRSLTTFLFLGASLYTAIGQNILQQPTSISVTGTPPDGSAVLELQATNRGLLVPRLSSVQRINISSPANGLLVFDTDTGGFWYFSGSSWYNLSAPVKLTDSDQDTQVQVEESPDEDRIRFDLGGSEFASMDGRTFHIQATGGSVFIGDDAGMNDDGTTNRNTFVGVSAGAANTSGYWNTAIGYQSLFSNASNWANSAIGYQSLYSNTNGFNNSAVGYRSLFETTTGDFNAAFGANALLNNTEGNYNTGIGFNAGQNGSLNQQCTAIGANSDVGSSTNSYTNAIAVGYDANSLADNYARIGNTSMTSIGGQVAWSNYSDGRFKREVQENVAGLDFINRLRPVTYQWDIHALNDFIPGTDQGADWAGRYDIETIRFSGFIAQEVEQAAKEAGYPFSGVDAPQNEHTPYALRYAEFVVPLVKAVQEQQAEIERLKAENERLNLVEIQLERITAALKEAGVNVP